ncbi:hypothetical protein [Caballeronia sp. Lep1P3]|uniref:hypothetical protein n=1 Tax=Caballeronia sp. Lep1P3 TaxID=2878150 RepID=UPI001FCF85C1|nr:hypothetical protein [Caballeronia sp. Lep1P3]
MAAINAGQHSLKRILLHAARASATLAAVTFVAACAAGGGTSASIPADARIASGRIASKQYLTTVTTDAASSSAPGVGVGVGGIGGSGWSGVGAGAGLSLDLTSLFEKRPEQTVKVYRYGVQTRDAGQRAIDSALNVEPGACVTIIDSSGPGYPRLMASNDC